MSIQMINFSRTAFLVTSWISMVVCMGTTMNEKVTGIAALMSVETIAPKELGEEVLLSHDDFAEEASSVGSVSKCESRICKTLEADAAFQTHVKASARLDGQLLPTGTGRDAALELKSERYGLMETGRLQEQSFLVLACECFICCQDILLFGLAIGSLYFWRYFRASQVGENARNANHCESPDNGSKTVAIRKAESSLNVDVLVKAMYSENKDDLRKMLDERSVNACDDACCCTALHIAAHYKCMEAAEALLDRGAYADVQDVWDETPLHFAARVGHTDICALLLKRGAQINASNAQGWTPLLVAAEAGMEETCEFLLDHAAHAGGIDEEDLPPLLSRLLQCRIVSGL